MKWSGRFYVTGVDGKGLNYALISVSIKGGFGDEVENGGYSHTPSCLKLRSWQFQEYV